MKTHTKLRKLPPEAELLCFVHVFMNNPGEWGGSGRTLSASCSSPPPREVTP